MRATLAIGAGALGACVQSVYPPVPPGAAPSNVQPRVVLTAPPAAEPECAHDVPVFDSGRPPARSYDVLSRVSVTCGVGLAQSCDQRLQARACAVHADAIVGQEENAPTGAYAPSKSAMLVRWRVNDAGAD